MSAAPLLFVFLIVVSSWYDQSWVWFLAQFRESELLIRLTDTLMEGEEPGFFDLILLVYLAGAAFYGALVFFPGKHGWREYRREAGLVAVSGAGVLLAILLSNVLWGRPAPLLVLGGNTLFVPWFQPGGVFSSGAGSWLGGSFPAAECALMASLLSLVLRLAPASSGAIRSAAIGFLLVLTVVLGVVSVYAQRHWPTDAIAGMGIGYAVPWLCNWWAGRKATGSGEG